MLKLIDEIFSNSLDEYIRTNGKFANKIKVIITPEYVEVTDNGRGIPQSEVDGVSQLVLAFTEMKAGTNFDEETKDDSSLGMNGVGSSIVNIFSDKFIVETCDGKNFSVLTCENNMEKIDHKQRKANSTKKYTKVKFYPSLERFGITKIDEIYFTMLKTRMFHLTQMFDVEFEVDYEKDEELF
jgi:DNA topoisomerase-2